MMYTRITLLLFGSLVFVSSKNRPHETSLASAERYNTIASCPPKQLKKDVQILEDFFAKKNITAQVHESGLRYVLLREGNGARPTENSTVNVKFKMSILGGEVVDAGTVEGKLKKFLPGWRAGLPLLPAGSSAVLYMPSCLGYGGLGVRDGDDYKIPPDAVLLCSLELLSVSE